MLKNFCPSFCPCKPSWGSNMSLSSNFNNLKKFTNRAFSYLLETPQQHPSLVAYTRYSLPIKYEYCRPRFLDLDEEATMASADHQLRPVMHPKRPLIMNAGYAETINAGKTLNKNEDQSVFCSFLVTVPSHMRDEKLTKDEYQMPCVYFGVFDGHAGCGAALFAKNKLHLHIKDRLTQISHMLVLSQEDIERKYFSTGLIMSIDVDMLVIGALEEAFLALDEEIKQERYDHLIQGGCTALAAIIFKGKLYVAGAGDSRCVLYHNGVAHEMSHDHTPETERKRIQTLAYYKPQMLKDEYTRFQFQHRCRRKDVGTRQLYRDYNMDGWSFKVIDKNDMKPQLICGEGKRARLLDTIGTTRGFGDHDLEVPYLDGMKIKPFMSASPEVLVYDLQDKTFDENDLLVLATDGLWERMSNERVGEVIKSTLSQQQSDESRRYIVAAQSLVDQARGALGERGWRTPENEVATYDDISVFVIPLKEWSNTLNLIQRSARHGSSVLVEGEEYCNISQNALAVVGERLTAEELNDVTKAYEDVSKTIDLKGLEKQQQAAETAGDGPLEKMEVSETESMLPES